MGLTGLNHITEGGLSAAFLLHGHRYGRGSGVGRGLGVGVTLGAS